jgi:hypothetical protein
MNIIDLLSSSDIEDVSIIFYCLLDRIPILILGDNGEEIDEMINALSTFLPFRNIMTFYDDFIDHEDYSMVNEIEEDDNETLRNLFLCFPSAISKLIENIHSFQSWIIGCITTELNSENVLKISEMLISNQNHFLTIQIIDSGIKTQYEAKKFTHFELNFEKWLFQNAINHTEISIEKMRRVISKTIRKKKNYEKEYKKLMNFSFEERELKENILRKEIINFFEACKRTYSILNRLKNFESQGLFTKISSRTLYSTIAYKHCSIDRILNFINRSWNIDFFSLLNTKKASNFTDTFESLWG